MRYVSPYETDKVRITLWVPKSTKERFVCLAKMFNQNYAALFSLVVDQMYFEPVAPTLDRTLQNTTQRIFQFFRKSDPVWKREF